MNDVQQGRLFDRRGQRERMERGIEAAVSHADRVDDGWSRAALACVKTFAARLVETDTFLAEDVVTWAESYMRLAPPPDRRAWGAVMLRAARNGWIRRDGFARDKTGAPKTLWRKVPL